ncbi:MAG: 16S rRNA (adenine(1518)-N(6)/adenine(1519)-N(6))-dimethyltransferase RsmA [Actinomycetota bacterium]
MAAEPRLMGAGQVRELLRDHGIRPSKWLGQNFVIDPNTIRKIIDVADLNPSDEIVEIGAGCGSLTLGLVSAARRVVAVEVDPKLVEVLRQVTSGVTNVEVVHADALELDLDALEMSKLVGNLPYNVAATLLLHVLESSASIRQLTVMTQREVGERLAAGPGSKVYGQTSVIVGFHADARLVGRVSRRAFFPEPNVDSVIVNVSRRPELPEVDPSLFGRVVRAAFSQRRKMLRGTLAPLVGGDVDEFLEAAGVDPSARPEALGWEEFVGITARLAGNP